MKESILSRIIKGLKYKIQRFNMSYNDKVIDIKSHLTELNEELAETLSLDDKNKITLTSLGNSIATGYSGKDIIKPLLMRNDSLEEILNNHNISTEFHSFARAQDNNDEHIFEWLNNDIKESEVNKMVHMDFGNEETSMLNPGLTRPDLEKYYPTVIDNDIGLKSLINQNDNENANIVVYNGYTGSFLDNISRHGIHFNLYGFRRDLISLEGVLKMIYFNNPNTQVYVCGVPNIFNIYLTELINKNLKKVCKLYPNVTYVKSVPACHMIATKDGKINPDPHYTIFEYLNLNQNIIKSINRNYFKNKMFIEFDQKVRSYSNEGQFKNHDIRRDKTLIDNLIEELLKKYYNYIDKKDLKDLTQLFKERYPHDYFYTDRKEMLDQLKEGGKQL